MKDPLILPLSSLSSLDNGYSIIDKEQTDLVNTWIQTKTKLFKEVWSSSQSNHQQQFISNPEVLSNQIIKILTHRIFNFQSKSSLSQLIPELKNTLLRQITNHSPIRFFLLYNGGYRASSFPNKQSLIFEPDLTELMLLYQITLLKNKMDAVYEPGIEFNIVLNNGVAHWVNEIPLIDTENYAKKLRDMIQLIGAEKKLRVLLQSELSGYNPKFSPSSIPSTTHVTEKEHQIVERFLGRSCTQQEAMFRSELYQLAEAKWEEDLSPLAKEKDAIMLRQIAHPDMLSFRPFPGGAIRIQNGSFGFQYTNNVLSPKLITSQSVKEQGLTCVHYEFNWTITNHS